MDKPKKDSYDFIEDGDLSQSFAEDYLRQYYTKERGVTDDETVVFQFISEMMPKAGVARTALEVGCGPTVHHAIMLAPFFEQIDLADYLPGNLALVERWLKNVPNAWNWNAYTDHCLKKYLGISSPALIAKSENDIRGKIRDLLKVNLLSEKPLAEINRQYDLVVAFYCTEEISLTVERWRTVMGNLASLITPGGYLLMGCLKETDFYHIRGANGEVRTLPCVPITEATLSSVVNDLFDPSSTIIRGYQTPEQAKEGVPGVLLTLAKKSA